MPCRLSFIAAVENRFLQEPVVSKLETGLGAASLV